MSKTKNKIISVAKNLFREISVYKATMSDIASADNDFVKSVSTKRL